MAVLRKLYSILDARERLRAAMIFSLMVMSAFLEVAGVASILPFIGVLANPEIIRTNHFISRVYQALDFNDERTFLIALGVVMLVFLLFSLTLRALTVVTIQRFSVMRIHAISMRLLKTYMAQPYEFFLEKNTSSLSKSLLSEVQEVAGNVMLPGMRALAGIVVSTAIVVLLIVVEPATSAVLAGSFGLSYIAIDAFTRQRVKYSGELRLRANDARFVVAAEALQGIKELRLLGREDEYLTRFGVPSRAYAHHQSITMITRELPFYFIQAVAFGSMLGVLLYWIARGDRVDEILPLMSFFAFAGYRLLPAFQDVFRGVGQVRFALPALDELVHDLSLKQNSVQLGSRQDPPLSFREMIRFENVDFQYRSSETKTLSDVSLEIRVNSSVAFVGQTGAGKSTIVDLLLGLTTATSGRITVDGVPLDMHNIRAWQMNLGYVPQQIFLADSSVSANIAFGVPPSEIDEEAVRQAAIQAHIHDFIVNELPNGYATIIGERGARLSGGQRQRLGIARALYRNPQVVVFDEATSALDTQTEAAVMNAISELGQHKTIVIIAHRLMTVRNCDQIILLDRGQLIARGSYETLLQNEELFQDLANASPQGVPLQ
ncbi:ABC transporter ATP-binding protein [Rhizobium laguerreae]|uniref:ABC transporter ATP-binding protein n=1 Tax=Rhizobium laguerreae TaxID=1076926 RepID=UPI00143F7B13|nr:ABC transporter ATP-binding protein [Rhizobium laguerreae]MBN9987119.1 ABC transporter ATP-binding protein [Rhizobium laguerreae]MBY3096068.1 ABC transporter ATP-binding protein [Rhizobium laguerreae]MBY3142850.1 ABC transporter ATP-binding protein [Rhizobium laguerreae]MBY3315999.1 ABC transporter ATP-binding protein [Rhizobium laguerreae]MBY3360616.1 ABC transporter ATP-binding protein [Rhizobium laguerreae]